jgi:hypothetical protein
MLKQLDVLIGFVTVLTIVSLLITVINQMIVSGLQLRGKSLLDALETMFKTIQPGLGDNARALAEAVLRHPAISDSARGGESRALASAIRPQELIDMLEKVGEAKPKDCPWIGNRSFQLAAKAGRGPGKIHIDELAEAARDLVAVLKKPAQALAPVNEVITEISAAIPARLVNRKELLEKVKTLETSVVSSAETSVRTAEKWLATVEDRAREWFATNAQKWNVAIAIFLAFVLQLDAIKLYRSLQDDTFRSATVAASANVEKKAAELLAATATSTDSTQAAAALEKARQDKKAIVDFASAAGFQLIPESYTWGWEHLLGMAIFAALLSMGAPYWFNLLKTLTNFRPALAQQIDKEKEQKTGVKT